MIKYFTKLVLIFGLLFSNIDPAKSADSYKYNLTTYYQSILTRLSGHLGNNPVQPIIEYDENSVKDLKNRLIGLNFTKDTAERDDANGGLIKMASAERFPEYTQVDI